jgi:hypothetical protein
MNTNDYETKLPCTRLPAPPAVFKKRALDLTQDEIKTFNDVKVQYDQEVAAARRARMAYDDDRRRLKEKFEQDLAAENGIAGHPRAAKVFELAWEHGHSAGFGDVANLYAEFAELVHGTIIA